MEQDIAAYESGATAKPFVLKPAKNGQMTAAVQNKPLHSAYNPGREAEQSVSRFNPADFDVALFFSCGLGYTPEAFHKLFPDTPMVIIEQDPAFLFAAFEATDWEGILSHVQVAFVIKAPLDIVHPIISSHSAKKTYIFAVPNQYEHSLPYFSDIKKMLQQNERKDDTNTRTLEKFAKLWLSNSCRNLSHLNRLSGILKYSNANASLATPIPFIVIAAGPSLEHLLPVLAELKKRAFIICVETALHSCLEAGIEPDFIVLVDPQYACARHLDYLESKSSILVTEVAVWPSVFRFPCKEIVLCSSQFPIGQYFEKKLGAFGTLGAGGSVATTAWDFARFCGAKDIYLAGMDLGFPGRQTHIRGSQFEEREHRTATRLRPSETQSTAALMSAFPCYAADYEGNKLLTDKKMSLFSWWFEKTCSVYGPEGIQTYSLTKESLAIKGISYKSVESLLCLPEREADKALFFARAKENERKIQAERSTVNVDSVRENFSRTLNTLQTLATKGINLAEKAVRDRTRAPEIFAELNNIDAQIVHSEAKDAAALVFPTEAKLTELCKDLPQDSTLRSLYQSKIIYSELKRAVSEYRRFIK